MNITRDVTYQNWTRVPAACRDPEVAGGDRMPGKRERGERDTTPILPAFMTALFALAFLAGCTSGPPPAGPLTAAELADAFGSRLASVDDYSMTVVQTASWGGKEIDILYRRPYQYLLENRYDNRTWTQAVRNLTWTEYHPDTNTADVLVIHNPESCFPPVADPNRLALDVLSTGTYNLSGPVNEVLDGRPAYRIDGVNTRAADNFGEGRLGTVSVWIDREQLLVVKIAAVDSSGTPVTTYRVHDLAVNTGIPDSAFAVTWQNTTKIRHPAPFCPGTGTNPDGTAGEPDEGLTPIPGRWIINASRLYLSNHTVAVRPGEEADILLTLLTKREGPYQVTYSAVPVAGDYSEVPVRAPGGIAVSIYPDNFTAVPWSEYRSTFHIETRDTAREGRYFYRVTARYSGVGTFWITVTVTD